MLVLVTFNAPEGAHDDVWNAFPDRFQQSCEGRVLPNTTAIGELEAEGVSGLMDKLEDAGADNILLVPIDVSVSIAHRNSQSGSDLLQEIDELLDDSLASKVALRYLDEE